MSATSDVADSVTVTCQASEHELRSAAVWLYLHYRAAEFGMLLIAVGAVVLAHLWGRIIERPVLAQFGTTWGERTGAIRRIRAVA